MSAGITYFWRKDKLEVFDRRIETDDFSQSSMLKYLYCPCIIQRAGFSMNQQWVGYFAQTEKFWVHWQPSWGQQLPDEFKLALLIAGVQL